MWEPINQQPSLVVVDYHNLEDKNKWRMRKNHFRELSYCENNEKSHPQQHEIDIYLFFF